MFESPLQARDEMFQLFLGGWEAVDWEGSEIAIAKPEVRWQGKEKTTDPIPDDYFVRIATRGAGSPLSGFIADDGPSAKAYDTFGNLFVQVFAPMNAEDSYRQGELIAAAARDIFRGVQTPSGVWFRNARYVELDDDKKFFRWNVIVEYEFSER
jgi:hypothetical protein